jgi:hypothetical protein
LHKATSWHRVVALTLEEEHVKNRHDLAELNALLESIYFKRLDSNWEKRVLFSQIKSNKTEVEKFSTHITTLVRTAQMKSFYDRLLAINGVILLGSGAWACRDLCRNQPSMLATYLFFTSMLTLLYPLAKGESAQKAQETLEKIKNLEMQRSDLEREVEAIKTSPIPALSPEQQTQNVKDFAVIPSNELF